MSAEGQRRTHRIPVRSPILKDLLEWCFDAIDFDNETDSTAAKAFNELAADAGLSFSITC